MCCGNDITEDTGKPSYLDGNRIAKVYDGANPVTTTGSMDFAGTTGSNSVFAYNSAGALTRDDSRGITSITYDNLGHPVGINFANGSYTTNVYSASGVRLKTVNSTALTSLASELETEAEVMEPDGIGVVTGSQTVTYRGNVVWRNGKVELVLIQGGYATLADGKESGAPTFHYYTTDYLGNVRAVTDGTSGVTEQAVAYYAFGGVIPTLGGNLSAQPFKFGGKELITANGLNEYDFGARNYAPMVPAFTSVDPLCEKYYWLSPYLYCANNPVNAIDPDGRSTYVVDIGDGKYSVAGGNLYDDDKNIYVYNKDNNGKYTIKGKSIGKTALMTSFYNSGDLAGQKGLWVKGAVIDTNDLSGKEFLNNIKEDNPSLFDEYMPNAVNGGEYDFKESNYTSGENMEKHHYRGMPIDKDDDGSTVYTSARDVGNIVAGYMAAVNGLSWNLARAGFDGYQSFVKHKITSEGISSQNAQKYGHDMGIRDTTSMVRFGNFGRSIGKGLILPIKNATNWLKSKW